METSLFFAQLIGITALAMGLSMVLKRKMLISIFHELAASRALSYILGTLIFIIGLLIILNHNVWYGGFPVVITLLGWGVTIEGTAYLFMSKESLEKYMYLLDSKKIYYLIAAAYLVLGSYLTLSGF